jgi:integrase
MGAKRQAKRRDWPPNLYQKPDGYFYYRNPMNGKVKGIGRDKPQAFQQARAANGKLAELKSVSLVAWVSGIEHRTLDAWLDDYLPMWVEEEKPAKGTLGTAKRYIARVKASDFAHLQVSDVSTKHIADFLDAIPEDSVAVNIRSRLLDIFRMAETKGLIETGRNPVAATKPRDYQVKRERLSLEQFLVIRERVTPWARDGMDLALLTGQRISDIVSMRFVDYRDGWLYIQQQKTGFKLQQDGKIRLAAVNLGIEEVIKRCRNRVISPYMVHHIRNSGAYKKGEPVSKDGLSEAFTVARIECGIEATQEGKTPPTFHEIRSLAERLYKKEYGQEFAQQIMGHKHAKTTAEYDDLRGSGWNVVQAK